MVWFLLFLVALYVGVLVLALRMSLYPIRTPIFLSPGALGTPQEDFEVATVDGLAIRGWWVKHRNPKGVAVLVHGYLMNRAELTPLAAWLYARGWASVIIDLRAHGKSTGKKSTLGMMERHDVAAAAMRAHIQYPGVPVVLIGSSMGSAACAFALAEDPKLAHGLVMDSAYSKLPDAVLGWWYFLGGKWLRFFLAPTVLLARPFVGFNPYRVDVGKALFAVRVPILFTHGEADTLAIPEGAKRNLQHCRDYADIEWFSGCGHSEGRWLFPRRFETAMERFLAKVVANYNENIREREKEAALGG